MPCLVLSCLALPCLVLSSPTIQLEPQLAEEEPEELLHHPHVVGPLAQQPLPRQVDELRLQKKRRLSFLSFVSTVCPEPALLNWSLLCHMSKWLRKGGDHLSAQKRWRPLVRTGSVYMSVYSGSRSISCERETRRFLSILEAHRVYVCPEPVLANHCAF